MTDLRARLEERARQGRRSATIGGATLEYCVCRVLPETALMLRDVLREARRLWRRELGRDLHDELQELSEGQRFFHGQIRLDSVPPDREVVVLWLPMPPTFTRDVEPRLLDCYEISEPPTGLRLAPEPESDPSKH